MSMPFYVAPEQVMKDRADYARKGIARGRALIAVRFEDGILIVAENPSNTLRKVSEIYDRIAFAGVGRYSEFEQLRIAGVRHADLKGYSFSREDVDARGLANAYAQILNQVFTHEIKPLEVEILVAEVATPDGGSHDQLFHILYDGTVMDENKFSVLGGEADAITERIESLWREGMSLGDGIGVSVASLAGEERTLSADDLEVAILSRTNGRRAFRRIEGDELTALVPTPTAPTAPPAE
jgi:proteasome alpha subunit